MSKYNRWYVALIKRARRRSVDCYVEKHHVKPKSLGGSNHPRNIVRLTYREHFLAHWLLTKMHSGMNKKKMCSALLQMCRRGKGKNRIFTSWQYHVARRAVIDAMRGRVVSKTTRKRISKSRLALGLKHTKEHLKKLSKRMRGNRYRRGKPLSKKTRKRMSLARIGNTNTLGNKLSKQHKAKISTSLLGNKRSVGRVLTPEHVAAIRAGHKKYWEARRGV